MSRSLFGLLVLASGSIGLLTPAKAADYAVAPHVHHYANPVISIDRGPNPYCGPRCGCPEIVRVRHRSLEQAYSYNFDPRTRDEPRYFYGGNHTYVRFVDPRNPDLVTQY